jgi:hypothetical protein
VGKIQAEIFLGELDKISFRVYIIVQMIYKIKYFEISPALIPVVGAGGVLSGLKPERRYCGIANFQKNAPKRSEFAGAGQVR